MKKIKKIIKETYKDIMPDQRATLDQLIDLWEIANLLKLYDAADYLSYDIRRKGLKKR